MLFKTLAIITAVTTAFAALIVCKQAQTAPATQKYTLTLLLVDYLLLYVFFFCNYLSTILTTNYLHVLNHF